MSLKHIKNTLESYLIANVTTVAIKMPNTTYYTLNGVALTQAQIDALKFYIEPSIIPIMQERELMSSSTPISYEAFFQVNIYADAGDGMGSTFNLTTTLDGLFREKILSGIVCLRTTTLQTIDLGLVSASGTVVITPYRVLAQYRSN